MSHPYSAAQTPLSSAANSFSPWEGHSDAFLSSMKAFPPSCWVQWPFRSPQRSWPRFGWEPACGFMLKRPASCCKTKRLGPKHPRPAWKAHRNTFRIVGSTARTVIEQKCEFLTYWCCSCSGRSSQRSVSLSFPVFQLFSITTRTWSSCSWFWRRWCFPQTFSGFLPRSFQRVCATRLILSCFFQWLDSTEPFPPRLCFWPHSWPLSFRAFPLRTGTTESLNGRFWWSPLFTLPCWERKLLRTWTRSWLQDTNWKAAGISFCPKSW